MAKNYWDAERLNANLKKMEDTGYMLPTTRIYIQEGLTRIVIANDLKNAGYIRTYEQAVSFLKRKYKENYKEYTIKEYQKEVKELQDRLQQERSYQGEIRHQRARMQEIVDDMNEFMDTNISIKNLTTAELYKAIKDANQMVKDSNAKSPMFYEYLADILEGRTGEA